MGFTDWIKNKSYEKSKSNILDCLRPLVAAVRADLDGAISGMPNLEQMDEAMENWRSRKAKVIEAQKNLYKNITIWSSLPPEQIFNDVILPALLSEQFVKSSESSFGPAIVAAYRVCEAAAQQNGINLASQISPEILQLVEDASDLYK